MAFMTACPWKDKRTGKLHLRQRTPSDLRSLKGTLVSLPLGGQVKTVKIGEMVQLSLHTRDATEAKRLHAIADAALKRFWDTARRGEAATGTPSLSSAVGCLPKPERVALTLPSSVEDSPLPISTLLEKWLDYHSDKKAKNTLKRYKGSLRSLAAFTVERDVRSLTDDGPYAWAEHRRGKEGVSPRAVNKNDLVAASSMFKWAMDRNGGRVIATNPAAGVHLNEPKKQW